MQLKYRGVTDDDTPPEVNDGKHNGAGIYKRSVSASHPPRFSGSLIPTTTGITFKAKCIQAFERHKIAARQP